LDRINAYYKTAFSEYNKLAQKESDINVEITKEQGKLSYIQTAIDELAKYEGKSKEEYETKLAELRATRDKFTAYKVHRESIIHLENEISSSKDKIRQYETRVSFDYEAGMRDLSELKSKLSSINEAYELTYKKSVEFESLLKEILKVESEGSSLAAEVDSLKAGRCPTCNSLLDTDKVESLKADYNKRLENLRSHWSELDDKFNDHEKGRDSKEYYFKVLNELKASHKTVSDNIELLNNKIVNYEKSKSLLDSEKTRLKELEDRLQLTLSSGIEEVKLPIDINDIEIQLNSDINNIESYNKYKEDLKAITDVINNLQTSIDELKSRIDKFNRYINLTSLAGVIIEEILKKLADKFSTPGFKYEVESGVYRGSRYINFNSYYLSGSKWMPYERCSDGQKNICDLDFLEKLFSVRIGLITLDEYLKHLDDDNFSLACEILGRMNANTILLSTHDPNLTVYSKRLLLELNSNGETVFNQV
jgi:chromosome segregation ATPase